MLEKGPARLEKWRFFHLTLMERGIILFKRMCRIGIEKRHRSLSSEKRRKKRWKELTSRKRDREKRNTDSEREWELRAEEKCSREEEAEEERSFLLRSSEPGKEVCWILKYCVEKENSARSTTRENRQQEDMWSFFTKRTASSIYWTTILWRTGECSRRCWIWASAFWKAEAEPMSFPKRPSGKIKIDNRVKEVTWLCMEQ